MVINHIVFIAGYIFYLFVYHKTGQEFIYPVYLAPEVIYSLLAGASFAVSKITKEPFLKIFKNFSISLLPLAFLFLTPVLLKLNIPEPHNFLQRKLELILGASYVLFLTALAGVFIKKVFTGRVFDREHIQEAGLPFIIVGFFFVLYFGLSLWFNYANEPTGDEPAYLLRAHSIVKDKDLDLKNNFDNKDYRIFYSKELAPQTGDIRKDGKIYSYHPFFLSFIMAPFYGTAGRLGVTALMNFTAAALIAMIFIMASAVFADSRTALHAALISGLTMPVLEFINISATDIVNPALLILAYICLRYPLKRYNTSIFYACCAILIWIHLRNLPLVASLALIYAWDNRRDAKKVAMLAVFLLLAAGILAALNYLNYGVIFSSYSSGNQGSIMQNFKPHNLKGTMVMFMDRQTGLIPYAPIYILSFAGIFFLYRENRRVFADMAVLVLPYFIMITSWHDWGSGSSSPRYFMPFIFVFSMLLAAVMRSIRSRTAKIVFTVLSWWSFAIAAVVACVPWFRWDKQPAENWIVAIINRFTGFNPAVILPSYRMEGQAPFYLTAAWLVIIAGLTFYYIVQAGKNPEKRKA
ncbi:MAG: hypothetical protein LLG37_06235 [Spirochaetia bacterium]|nr:hypothetical protein [Spirochaetia bacterium]